MPHLKSSLSGLLAAMLLFVSSLAQAIPEIQNWRTTNGVPVYFIAARELPMVDAQILFGAGSVRDGEQPGLAKLTNGLLEEGAGDWSADAIADRLDQVGARLATSSRRDSASVALRSLTDPRYLQPAVETVARLLKDPTFAPDAVDRVRKQMLTALQERAQSPGAIAQDAFFKALYGDHPYGSPSDGTSTSLNAITRVDIQNFHRRHYTAANAVIAIVGDLDRPAAEQLANALVDGLPKGQPIPPPPPVPALTASQTVRIPHPSSQSHILIGQLGVSRADPDYYALYLGNHVLGGNGLVSQLSQEIREKRGLAYGAYSAFSPMRQTGPFLINLQTRNDQADTALQVAQTTLRQFSADGPDSADVGGSPPEHHRRLRARPRRQWQAGQLSGTDRVLRPAAGLPANLHRHHERHRPGAGQERLATAHAARATDRGHRRWRPERADPVVRAGWRTRLPDLAGTGRHMNRHGGHAKQLRVIGGQWRGRRLAFPDLPGLRPTPDRVRETLFNWLAPVLPGARCLDLFAGSGALGIEALSRGAADVVFVERHPLAARTLRDQLDRLHAQSARVEQADALAWLGQPGMPFEIVLLDPPFGQGLLEPACAALEAGGWLAAHAWIYLEAEMETEVLALPVRWTLHREKTAGAVTYRLARRGGGSV